VAEVRTLRTVTYVQPTKCYLRTATYVMIYCSLRGGSPYSTYCYLRAAYEVLPTYCNLRHNILFSTWLTLVPLRTVTYVKKEQYTSIVHFLYVQRKVCLRHNHLQIVLYEV
jgi:hypothetical protein